MTSIHPSLRADSVAGRVVAFFAANRDESLGISDIAEKFDASRGNIHTLLAKTIELRLLTRGRDGEGDYVYTAGPSLPAPPPRGGVDIDRVHNRGRTAHGAGVRAPALDLNAIPLAEGIPIPPLRGRGSIDYQVLLARMTPGVCAELPLSCDAGLSKAIGSAHKSESRRFVIRRDKAAATLRVWRTK